MKWFIVAALGLSLSASVPAGAVLAQNQVDYDDASGTNGDCTVSGPSNETLVYCKSLHPGHGTAIMDSPGASAPPTKDAPPEAAPAEEPPRDATTDAPADTAVASPNDQDADNAPDDQEPGLGLDPSNPDTDGDNVADGDEMNIYGTDPTNPDTDGDGASDGNELFGIHTDPLVPNDASTQDAGATIDGS
jgi:hypothetical protein